MGAGARPAGWRCRDHAVALAQQTDLAVPQDPKSASPARPANPAFDRGRFHQAHRFGRSFYPARSRTAYPEGNSRRHRAGAGTASAGAEGSPGRGSVKPQATLPLVGIKIDDNFVHPRAAGTHGPGDETAAKRVAWQISISGTGVADWQARCLLGIVAGLVSPGGP